MAIAPLLELFCSARQSGSLSPPHQNRLGHRRVRSNDRGDSERLRTIGSGNTPWHAARRRWARPCPTSVPTLRTLVVVRAHRRRSSHRAVRVSGCSRNSNVTDPPRPGWAAAEQLSPLPQVASRLPMFDEKDASHVLCNQHSVLRPPENCPTLERVGSSTRSSRAFARRCPPRPLHAFGASGSRGGRPTVPIDTLRCRPSTPDLQ